MVKANVFAYVRLPRQFPKQIKLWYSALLILAMFLPYMKILGIQKKFTIQYHIWYTHIFLIQHAL